MNFCAPFLRLCYQSLKLVFRAYLEVWPTRALWGAFSPMGAVKERILEKLRSLQFTIKYNSFVSVLRKLMNFS